MKYGCRGTRVDSRLASRSAAASKASVPMTRTLLAPALSAMIRRRAGSYRAKVGWQDWAARSQTVVGIRAQGATRWTADPRRGAFPAM